MPQGDKRKYTAKQQRKAEHIEEGYERRGVSKREAERRAWATVNKQEGGGKKPGGSGRKGSASAKSSSSKSKKKSATSSKTGGGGRKRPTRARAGSKS